MAKADRGGAVCQRCYFLKEIEPIHALAFSMQARPKLYALLLGSGVSKTANIPTGWDVVLDLIRKLAAMDGKNPKNPCQWYLDKYDAEPNYSDLLERIAPTSPDRQQLQRQYWEGNSESETKQPTKAHQAIAKLVKGEFVKIIVTTNFDRLIENALRDVGVEPMILRSPDDIAGMTPLDHTKCCVLKLHGDYMDERIRNTTDELADYPDVVDKLLDRIFDEYGLLVCGWSGSWDVALSKAIRRSSARRYTTYWAAYGDLEDEAKRIVENKEARVIEIESADRFFVDLSNLIHSLKNHMNPHPLSIQATVAQCKHLLAHDHHRIDLLDLIDSIGREALSELADLPELGNLNGNGLTNRMRRYDEICSKLLATTVTASYWSDASQIEGWRNTVELFFQDVKTTGKGIDILLSSYPAVLLTYGLGIGAVAHGRLDNLGKILEFPTGRDIEEWSDRTAVRREGKVADGLNDMMLQFVRFNEYMQTIEGMDRPYVPLNDWIYKSLRQYTVALVPSEKRFERIFDRLEVLLSLGCGVRANEHLKKQPWFPVGCFVYRNATFQNTIGEIEDSLKKEGDNSPFVRYVLVGHHVDEAKANLKAFRDFVVSVRNEFHIHSW